MSGQGISSWGGKAAVSVPDPQGLTVSACSLMLSTMPDVDELRAMHAEC